MNRNQNNFENTNRGRGFGQRPRGRNRGRQNNINERNETGPRQNNFTNSRSNTNDEYRRGPRKMGFTSLRELINNNNLEDMVFILNNDRKGFKTMLDDNNLSPDMIVLIIQLLSKICNCNFEKNITFLLTSVVESCFSQTILTFVSTIAVQTSFDKNRNKYFWNDPDDFWKNIISLSKTLNGLLPSTSCDFNLKLMKSIKMYIPHIEDNFKIHISDNIKNEVKGLCEVIEKIAKDVERRKEEIQRGYVHVDEDVGPPNDFRDISVYPSAAEITNREPAFLRPNVVRGPYQDIGHYLDVQYRLLREDFVLPLRNGICSYIERKQGKLEDIKVYNPIRFLNRETISDQNCYLIQFDFSKKKRNIQYEHSKQFMFGSLLCFTSDGFTSVFFAKVAQRDIPKLENGQLIVGFNQDVILPENLYDMPFIMIESKVYFEPYYQVLNVLKKMPLENFPMERYVINVNTATLPPEYLLKIDPVYLKIEDETFWPLSWGNRRFYGLNDAQSLAFQAALTREFAVIQGPPGTGKTFLGLKVAKTLLENKDAWYKNTPMLVICFTNHALDQFLEGLIPTTNKLIRVGGQSKNENLKEFNIRSRKNRPGHNPAIIQKRIEVKNYIDDIASLNGYLSEIEKYHSVIDFKVFEKIVENFGGSWFNSVTNDKIIQWLLAGGQNQVPYFRRQAVPPPPDAEAMETDNVPERNENENLDEEKNELVDDLFEDAGSFTFKGLISISELTRKVENLRRELYRVQTDDMLSPWEKESREDMLQFSLYNAENDLETLKFRLAEGRRTKGNIEQPEFIDLKNPNRMPPDSRWQMYFYWLALYENRLRQKKERISQEFARIYSVFSEMRDMEDTQIMKSALVIGMTTTGAARLQSSLQALKSPIVIVEEAAEVLEAHIVAALTPYCKHLILIGDHQQLKPSTANYAIETKFKLGISLFERMVLNDIQCYTLNIQHRMRPEIANLVRPAIYPVLNDHSTVLGRPHILGVEHDLFFIDHTEKEDLCADNSKKNIHEVKFLIQFARHLILNGYKPENIVILAAYLGQMFEMQRERKNHRLLLQDVRIAVLDNYQGEESDIVLLSLVRSNPENKIGFLRIENRVCVALSRARNGLYIMGNMKLLCQNSEIWPKILETLKRQDAVGPHLTLRCQIHRFQTTNVSKASDFLRLPEGGCDLLCEAALCCGHTCKRLCHVEDRAHENYACREKCEKLLCDNPEHPCRKFCYQLCGPCWYPVERLLKCGHSVNIKCHLDPDQFKCTVLVESVLPCLHKTKKPCSADPEKFKCPFPCDTRVEPCGHACTKSCHITNDPDHLEYSCRKPCERKRKGCTSDESHTCLNMCCQECEDCVVPVLKKLTKCNHMLKIACNANPDDINCQKPCKKMLPCGHHCKKTCFETCGDCQVMVEKIVPDCNHTIKIECCKPPSREFCKNVCPRKLACGHLCNKKCNEECRTRCKEIVDCSIASPCGHLIKKISCYLKYNHDDKILLNNCMQPCDVVLKCKHKCLGTCGTCVQGRFHRRCQEKCGVPLVCNHECQIPCREACKPCKKNCEYRCKHSRCTKLCGNPCTPCKEKCPRSCKHQTCSKKCGEMCDVEPCDEPCPIKLKCGHECVGYCGDPCPKLCRICNEDELTETFFGTEDEEDARFVLLQDCGHTLESIGMAYWLNQTENEDKKEIKPIVCPKCKTAIKKTTRYSDFVKESMEDLRKVKAQYYGDPKEINFRKHKLRSDIRKLLEYMRGNKDLTGMYVKLLGRLEDTKNKRIQNINMMDLDAIRMKIELLEMIIAPLKTDNLSLTNLPLSNRHISFIVSIFDKNLDSTTQQEVDDIKLEIDRLNRLIQFDRIKYQNFLYMPNVQNIVAEITKLVDGPFRYNKDCDSSARKALEELKKITSSTIVLTEVEKRDIVQAIGLSQGHWYKCPNGHPYVIADCGGATMISTCPECKANIGGMNHRLLRGNAVATEMDGARRSAWPGQRNNVGDLDL